MNFEIAKNKLSEYLEKVKNQNNVRRRKKQNSAKNTLPENLRWPTLRASLLRLRVFNCQKFSMIGQNYLSI